MRRIIWTATLVLSLLPATLQAEEPSEAALFKGKQPFFFQNTPQSCGPTCGKMVIATLTGKLVPERSLHAQSRSPILGRRPWDRPEPYGTTGTCNAFLAQALRQNGVDAHHQRAATWKDLRAWTKGGPVIAAVSDGRAWAHDVVIDRVVDRGRAVEMRDPALGKITVPVDRFLGCFTGDAIRCQAGRSSGQQPLTAPDEKQRRIFCALTLVDAAYSAVPTWPVAEGPWHRLERQGRTDWAIRIAP